MGRKTTEKRKDGGGDKSPPEPAGLLKLAKTNSRLIEEAGYSVGLLVVLVSVLSSAFLVLELKSAMIAVGYAIFGMVYVVVRRGLMSRFSDLMGLNASELRAALDAVFASLGAGDQQVACQKIAELQSKALSLAALLDLLGRKQIAQAKLRVGELVTAFPKAEELRKLLLKLGAEDVAQGEKLVLAGQSAVKDLAAVLQALGKTVAKEGVLEIERRANELTEVQGQLRGEKERHEATRRSFVEPRQVPPPVRIPEERGPFLAGLTDDEARRRLSVFPEMEVELLNLRASALAAVATERELRRRVDEQVTSLAEAAATQRQLINEKEVLLRRMDAGRKYYESQQIISRGMLQRLGVLTGTPDDFESEMTALLGQSADLYRSAGTKELFRAARKLKAEVDRLLVIQYAAASLGAAGRWDLMQQLFQPLMGRKAFDQVLPRMDTSVRVWVNEHTVWPGIA